jgi:hypothetical protein
MKSKSQVIDETFISYDIIVYCIFNNDHKLISSDEIIVFAFT